MIIYNQRERCGDWAKQFIPHVESWGEWYQAIGLEREGALQAVVIYNFYSQADIAMHIAAVPGAKWMSKGFLQAAFRYPFVQLGTRRVTGYVPAKNLVAQRFDEHLGFRREGLMRDALVDDDVIVYGMLKSECRWIYGNSKQTHGSTDRVAVTATAAHAGRPAGRGQGRGHSSDAFSAHAAAAHTAEHAGTASG